MYAIPIVYPIIAIGASTGGMEALRVVLSALPPDAPGVVVVQHMPQQFTRGLAEWLDEHAAIAVREAAHGDRILRGTALVAPGDRHLRVMRDKDGFWAALDDGPPVNYQRPSVDVLFESCAEAAGPSAVGVILTGMGHDGAQGLRAMRGVGAGTIAQDRASSIVYGMPREAARLGAAQVVLPLRGIAGTAVRMAANRRGVLQVVV